MELPAAVEVGVDVLRSRPRRVELARGSARIRSSSAGADGGGAEARGEPLEPEPRGVELLEVLAREPADERPPVVADLDEARALERDERVAHRRLRDAEPLGEVALHERRPLGRRPATISSRSACVARCSIDRRPSGSMSARLRARLTSAHDRCMLARPRFEISCRATLSHGDDGDNNERGIGVDVGGTFTDVILQRADGTRDDPQAALDAAELRRGGRQRRSAGSRPTRPTVAAVVHGTTVATNAVLERRGALTALVTTAGFRDVLELRRLRIPHMYDPFWRKPEPLVPRRRRYEVNERVTADGTVLRPLDDGRGARRRGAARGRRRRVGRRLPAALVPLPGARGASSARSCARSCPASPSRSRARSCASSASTSATATTVVNAYVRPLMGDYVAGIRSGLDARGDRGAAHDHAVLGRRDDRRGRRARGRCSRSSRARPRASSRRSASRSGSAIANAISFDMGGTTAKASLIEDGAVSRGREYEVGGSLSAGSRLMRGAGELLRIPTIDIAEVGAGGGSIAWLDAAGGLQVGPRSAGAAPGPACYGRGGEERDRDRRQRRPRPDAGRARSPTGRSRSRASWPRTAVGARRRAARADARSRPPPASTSSRTRA